MMLEIWYNQQKKDLYNSHRKQHNSTYIYFGTWEHLEQQEILKVEVFVTPESI